MHVSFRLILIGSALLGLIGRAFAADSAVTRRPNILFIFAANRPRLSRHARSWRIRHTIQSFDLFLKQKHRIVNPASAYPMNDVRFLGHWIKCCLWQRGEKNIPGIAID
jgi:hypothetical protein